MSNAHHNQHNQPNGRFSRSISDLDSVENKIEAWRQRSTEALNKEGLHNDNIEVIVSNKSNGNKGMRHDPNIDDDVEEDEDDDERRETSFVSQRDSAATRVRSHHNHHRRRRASSANNDHRSLEDEEEEGDEDDDDPHDDNYKVWAGNHGNRLPGGASLSASTPHLHHIRQTSAPNFIDPETGRVILAPGNHPHHHHLVQPVVLHDGRGTLRSVRTTASSLHHPQFRPPSVSSRSMINLNAPHPSHIPLTPPHHPLGFHVIHGPPPPPHIMAGPQGHFPFPPPVPTTLSKKQLKSLKSSMKKLQKKGKGMIPPPDFIMNPPLGPVIGSHPPFFRGPIPMPHHHHHPPPHAIPMLVRGPPPHHLLQPMPPPRGRSMVPPHPLLHHPIEEPMYATHSRPMTPVNGSIIQGRRSSLQQRAIQTTKHDSNSDEQPSDSSIFNNGIYRKRANLNEKAFSHSIRQESQSRSGSVANVQYSDNENSGPGSLGGQFKPNGRLSNGHHHPLSMMSSSTHEDEILAQSLENLHLTTNDTNNVHLSSHNGSTVGVGSTTTGQGSKLMMLMKQRNGNNSTSSQSSSIHSSSQQQTQPHHPHSNYTNGVGHHHASPPSLQDNNTSTILNQGNNSNGNNSSNNSNTNNSSSFKTASIKRGSGSSLQYHLHNTNGVVH
jgi:hypothetical protein